MCQYDFIDGSLTDLSGNGYNLASGGYSFSTVNDRFSGSNAIYFPGTNNGWLYYQGSFPVLGSSDRTISVWVNFPATGGGIAASIGGLGCNAIYALGVTLSSICIYGNCGGVNTFCVDIAISADTWHHVVASTINSYSYVYLDGKRVGSGPKHIFNTGNSKILVGAALHDNSYSFWGWFRGSIDDVRIYVGGLNADYVNQLFTGRSTGQFAA